MVTIEKYKDKTSKYAQCTSCHCTENVHEILIGKYNNNRMVVQLCDRCMTSLIAQYNGTYKADDNGVVWPIGTFSVGPFICEVLAKYKDTIEIGIAGTHNFSDYTTLSILTQRFGTGILVSSYSKGCIASIPLENIVERGGLI